VIFEMARIRVTPGEEAAFEAAVAAARPLFQNAKGCSGMELHRIVETPGDYLLLVRWNTLEDHTVGFRGSPDFQRWRQLAGPFFAAAPEVLHTEPV